MEKKMWTKQVRSQNADSSYLFQYLHFLNIFYRTSTWGIIDPMCLQLVYLFLGSWKKKISLQFWRNSFSKRPVCSPSCSVLDQAQVSDRLFNVMIGPSLWSVAALGVLFHDGLPVWVGVFCGCFYIREEVLLDLWLLQISESPCV